MNDGYGGYEGGSSQGTPGRGGSSGGRPRKGYDEQTLIPVTIRMLMNATPSPSADGTGDLSLADGRGLHQIKLVGAVRSYEDMSTNVVFLVEDGTGLIEVKMWTNDQEDCAGVAEMRQSAMQDHVYVRVIGQLKDYDGRKQVVAYSIRKVSTCNEMTHHMLEVVFSSENFKKKDRIAGQAAQPFPQTPGGVGFGGNTGMGMQQGYGMVKAEGGGGSGNELNDLVLNYIRDKGEHTEQGASIGDLLSNLTAGGKFGEPQIRDSINHLSAEGLIYSTINEDHYKYAA